LEKKLLVTNRGTTESTEKKKGGSRADGKIARRDMVGRQRGGKKGRKKGRPKEEQDKTTAGQH